VISFNHFVTLCILLRLRSDYVILVSQKVGSWMNPAVERLMLQLVESIS